METEQRQTSAEIKKQIEQATKAEKIRVGVKDGSIPLTTGVVNEINASQPTPEESPKTESKPQAEKPAEKATAESVDLKEWAKKAGYDPSTEESVLSTLRKAAQVFHKRQQEKKAQQPPTPVYMPPSPVPQYGYQQPYAPPVNQRQIIEQLARENNMTVEDFERVAKVSRDMAEAIASQDRLRYNAELESIKVENQKNSVFRELSSDPVFRKPEVAREYYDVLEQMQGSDPDSFEKDPNQYKRAYERAIFNIGRRNLEGRPLSEGVPPQVNSLPATPPKPFGQTSGGGYAETESSIDMNAWNHLSPEGKKKWFQDRGLVSNY